MKIEDIWECIKNWVEENKHRLPEQKFYKDGDPGMIESGGYVCIRPDVMKRIIEGRYKIEMRVLADTECIFAYEECGKRVFTKTIKTVRFVVLNYKLDEEQKERRKADKKTWNWNDSIEEWGEMKRWITANRERFVSQGIFNPEKHIGMVDWNNLFCIRPEYLRRLLGRKYPQTTKLWADTECIFTTTRGEYRSFTISKRIKTRKTTPTGDRIEINNVMSFVVFNIIAGELNLK